MLAEPVSVSNSDSTGKYNYFNKKQKSPRDLFRGDFFNLAGWLQIIWFKYKIEFVNI